MVNKSLYNLTGILRKTVFHENYNVGPSKVFILYSRRRNIILDLIYLGKSLFNKFSLHWNQRKCNLVRISRKTRIQVKTILNLSQIQTQYSKDSCVRTKLTGEDYCMLGLKQNKYLTEFNKQCNNAAINNKYFLLIVINRKIIFSTFAFKILLSITNQVIFAIIKKVR